MSWSMALGINSCNAVGIRTTVRCTDIVKRRKPARARKIQLPLSDDEVRMIRQLHETGTAPSVIFNEHVKGRMTYSGMMSILNWLTRTKLI